ncbi:MAG: AAA family ATPase, partial [Planctomycetales bacterium]|nr:AAA family ATPase [Planctomycetales bacterium]
AKVNPSQARVNRRAAVAHWQQQRFRFEAFAAGGSNRLAVEASREAARNPGRYSPLLLHGASGCGKTHLLHAIAGELRRHVAPLRILQLTAEEFTAQFLEALHQRKSPGFRHKVRGVDALLLDDVEFLAGKQATMTEFLSTLDALQQRGGQCVLTCAGGPQQLARVCPDLAARVAGGLAVTIELPEYEARRQIVQQTALRCQMELGEGVADLVAQRVSGSARLLAGALNRLAAVSMAERRPIDKALADEALIAFGREHSPQVRLADIQRAVCEVFGVEPQSLKSSKRTQVAANPRMLAMWLARRYTRAALSEIGDFFGRRSHSTVVSAQHKMERLIGDNAEIRVADRSCSLEETLRRVEAILRTG